MSEENIVISIENLGKMYKLYKNPNDKILDAFGLNFFKKDYYKEFWALRGIDLKIRKGERVGFIGHNGAGKSTLLKIITGNIKPTEGDIKVKGSIQALLEMGTGFHPEFTGRQNIRASLAYQGLDKAVIDAYEEEIIDFTELEAYIDQPVKTYSAGMYSRLAFATASAVIPELMIIDEILGAGDAYFNGKCVERMQKLTNDKGATILFVSHDLQSIQNLCTRVIWINKGKIAYDGDVLTGIKLYLQSVRQNEEQRLKIRDMKAANKQAMILDTESELYEIKRYRFVNKDGQMGRCRIYRISVYADGQEIDSIDVGASMDNDPNSKCHIVDEVGVTCWSKACREDDNYYREFNNKLGKEADAPFVIKYSKAYTGDIELRIEAQCDDSYGVIVQEYIHEAVSYQDCCMLAPEGAETIVRITGKTKEKSIDISLEEPDASIDVINTNKAAIESVYIKGGNGEKGNVFSYKENINGIGFTLRFIEKQLKTVFVLVSIYSIKGDLIHSTAQKVSIDNDLDAIDFFYPINDMKFGPGEYTISIGAYEELDVSDNTREAKFLVLFDRAISFSVEKPLDYALGIGAISTATKIQVLNLERGMYSCDLLT